MSPKNKSRMMACMSAAKMSTDGDEDDMMSRHLDEHEKMAKDLAAHMKYGKDMAAHNMSREEEITTLQTALETAEAEKVAAINLSRESAAPATLNPEVAHERHYRLSREIDNLVTIGKATPASAEKLSELLIGTKGTPNLINLSREDGEDDCFAGKLVDLLKRWNAPPATGEKTTMQTLSRENLQSGAQAPATTTKPSPYTANPVPVPTA